MPAGYDAEVAELFRDLRAATALSEMDLAAKLGTRAEVVQALEQGALYALPPWAETCRVVNAYGALLNLDVRPLLRRIYAQLEAGIVELAAETDARRADDDAARGAAGLFLCAVQCRGLVGAQPARHSLAAAGPAGAAAAAMPGLTGRPAPSPQPQAPWQNAQPQPQAPRPNPHPAATASRKPGPAVSRRRSAPRQNPRSRSGKPNLRRQPQGQPQRPPQPRAPQPQQPQAQARPQPMPPRPAPPPEPHPLDADFGEPVPLEPTPEPAKPKRRRPALLKWGLGALVISIVAFGLWMALSHAPGPAGITGGQSGAARSRRSAEPQGRPACPALRAASDIL